MIAPEITCDPGIFSISPVRVRLIHFSIAFRQPRHPPGRFRVEKRPACRRSQRRRGHLHSHRKVSSRFSLRSNHASHARCRATAASCSWENQGAGRQNTSSLPQWQAVLSALFPASWRSPAWNFHDEKSSDGCLSLGADRGCPLSLLSSRCSVPKTDCLLGHLGRRGLPGAHTGPSLDSKSKCRSSAFHYRNDSFDHCVLSSVPLRQAEKFESW
jgi:hypothetical protein